MIHRALILFATACASVPISSVAAKTHDLPATPQTVAWGHYDATDKPVLTIQSGDSVVIHTPHQQPGRA